MPGLFLARYYKRQRRARAQRFHDQHILNRIAWGEYVPIADLQDPSGKRLLFDGSAERPVHSFESEQGPSGA